MKCNICFKSSKCDNGITTSEYDSLSAMKAKSNVFGFIGGCLRSKGGFCLSLLQFAADAERHRRNEMFCAAASASIVCQAILTSWLTSNDDSHQHGQP